ncbi:hypothetical protein EGW08_016314 [Elysia chlorotica]|uniref:Reverse transcriptase domain-containing protein n=1 Tax=Elysia chlorotica TaxID=188477 RepID=A0A3S0ZV17_ELYCH|nr:hypothetical protein EGW08_016314 [Elysia chlorotica]
MKKRKQRKGTPEYAALNLLIRSECRKAKEKWLQGQCSKVESSSLHGRSKTMYDTLKEIRGTTRQNNSTGCIKDKEGNMLFEQDKIKARWVEYVGDLFDDARPEKPTMPNEEGPPIMREEVEYALRGIKDGKASGLDNITIEMLKALKEFGVDELTKLCNDIYDTGHLPNDMKESVFITLPKTPSATECGNFRTISLMSHTMKLLLKIILNRIGPKINKEVGHEQFGFRPNSGTREGIMCMKMVCEKYLEKHKDIYVCFIDYAKAFDRVHHTKLIECLKGIGIDGKDKRIIRNLYWEQTSCIRIGEEVTDQTNIQRGVRQGCVMSPSLFNLYTEIIFRNINELPGMNISGQNINNIRYADDTALVAETPEQLQALLDKVNEESENCGLAMNAKKTKVMVISRKDITPKININIGNTVLEQVSTFIYLGQLISDDNRADQDIKRRIGIAKTSFNSLLNTFTSNSISMKTKLQLLKTFVWSTLLYGVIRDLYNGEVEGSRGRGRPRTKWNDNIAEWTCYSLVQCQRLAQDRCQWRAIAANLRKETAPG